MQRALKRVACAVVLVGAGVASVYACSRDPGSGDARGTIPVQDGGFDVGSGGGGAQSDAADPAADAAADVTPPPVSGATWQLVPGSEFSGPECWHFQAAPGTLSFPKLEWKNCGAGCELADVIQGYPVDEAGAIAASTTQGQALVRFKYLMPDAESTKLLTRVVRLSDGHTVAAVLRDDHGKGSEGRCFLGLSENSARLLAVVATHAGQERELLGLAPEAADGAWQWALPPLPVAKVPPGKSAVTTDSALFHFGSGGVYALPDMTKSDWTTLEEPSTARFAGGDGDLVVWTESSSDRVRGWAPDGKGPRTLLEQSPGKTYLAQPSNTRIVGVSVDPEFENTLSTSVRFWHMPRTYQAGPSPVVMAVSASQVMVNGTVLRTWGDYAAVPVLDHVPGAAFDSDALWLLVTNLVTGKAWRVQAAPGFALQSTTWALDDTWLYFAETLPGIKHENSLKQIRRVQLSQLGSWAKETK
ncbi:MAG: hypothetical protein HYZ29_05735 [Myxococcales bacterium]|nr:hypothetical protein [Myxococcales bacterium]